MRFSTFSTRAAGEKRGRSLFPPARGFFAAFLDRRYESETAERSPPRDRTRASDRPGRLSARTRHLLSSDAIVDRVGVRGDGARDRGGGERVKRNQSLARRDDIAIDARRRPSRARHRQSAHPISFERSRRIHATRDDDATSRRVRARACRSRMISIFTSRRSWTRSTRSTDGAFARARGVTSEVATLRTEV